MDDQTSFPDGSLEERVEEALRQLVTVVHQIEDFLRGGTEKATQAQLKAVNSSVRQLTKQGFPVPDELRHLKMTLLKEESGIEEVVAVRKRIAAELRGILQTLEPGKVQPAPETRPKKRRGKKDGDDKILDLFAWKAEGQ